MASLVDQSLVRGSSSGRYEIHELLRQYGEERLHEVPDEYVAARDRHCTYYTTFLQQRQNHLKGFGQRAAASEILEEIENVRAAWLWAAEHVYTSELDAGLEALWIFYELQSRLHEGQELLRQSVQWIPESNKMFGQLLSRRAWLLIPLGKYEEARSLLEQS